MWWNPVAVLTSLLERERERKASYNISPRFPNMRHWESGDPIQLPWENQVGAVDGIDVEFHTSNIEPECGLELLPEFYAAVFEHAEERVHPEYFRTDLHSASRMWAYERYVRIRRELAGKLSSAGVLQKVAHYLSDLEGVNAELHIDNEEVVNHQNRLFLNPASAANSYPATPTGGSSRSTSWRIRTQSRKITRPTTRR